MKNVFALTEDWGNIRFQDEIIIYGTGRIGRRVLPHFIEEFRVPFLIDNKDAGASFFNIEILDVNEGVKKATKRNIKIVVTTMRGAYNDISLELTKRGLTENHDFCIFERFVQEWNLRWHNRCVLAKIDTVITSRCTLKCRNCNIFISHINNPHDIPLESLKENFDVFFDCVDYVYEYSILGGEPFLHKEIFGIIEYLTNCYGNRIGKINIISNGTVIPDHKMLDMMKQYRVSVHISNYTSTVPYETKLIEVCKALLKNEIEYYVIPNNVWKNIVYPELSYMADDPKKHMLTCGHSTHSVGDGKLYWCDPAFAAEKFMGFLPKPDDYLDLYKNKKINSKYDASLNIMKYLMGDMNDRGYMSICEKCAGIGVDNNRVVIAGEQVTNNG